MCSKQACARVPSRESQPRVAPSGAGVHPLLPHSSPCLCSSGIRLRPPRPHPSAQCRTCQRSKIGVRAQRRLAPCQPAPPQAPRKSPAPQLLSCSRAALLSQAALLQAHRVLVPRKLGTVPPQLQVS